MSKGFFVKDDVPVYFGTRADKLQLESGHDWVPSDDSRAAALREAMNAETERTPRPTLQDLIDELAKSDPELKTRLQTRADTRK